MDDYLAILGVVGVVGVVVAFILLVLAVSKNQKVEKILLKIRGWFSIEVRFQNEFGEGSAQLIKDAEQESEIYQGIKSAKVGPIPEQGISAQSAVLKGWDQLAEILKQVAQLQEGKWGQLTDPFEIVGKLAEEKRITPVKKKLLIQLCNQVRNQEKHLELFPRPKDANIFQQVAGGLAQWIKSQLIPPPKPKPKPPRHTTVGAYFPPPVPGHAAAVLVGTRGTARGKRFQIDKEISYIGADPDNDLVISGDAYVSRKHASLRYESGSLLLVDSGSRNGTFINDKRLADTPWTLSAGDRIRIGGSTFRLTDARS